MHESFIFAVLIHPGFLGDSVAVTPGATYSEKSDSSLKSCLTFIRVQALKNLAFLSSRFDCHS